MARFQHEVTGVVINVDEATAANLEPGFRPLDGAPKPKRRSPARQTAKRSKAAAAPDATAADTESETGESEDATAEGESDIESEGAEAASE